MKELNHNRAQLKKIEKRVTEKAHVDEASIWTRLDVVELVKAYPAPAVAFAAGIGFIVGALWNRAR